MTPTISVDTLVYMSLGLLALAYVAILILMALPSTRAQGRALISPIVSGTLVIGVILLGFWLGGWWLAGLLTLAGTRLGFEAGAVLGLSGTLFGILLGGASALLVWFALIASSLTVVMWLFVLFALAWLLCAVFRRKHPVLGWLLFPAVPFLCLVLGSLRPETALLALVAFILSETFDSYAYVSGKVFGRTQAFPILSPKKTVEGLIGGAIMLVVTAVLMALLFDIHPGRAALIAVLIGALTLAGDILGSHMKRVAGVKDFPVLIPDQGGLLDTMDAWIMAGGGICILAVLSGAA